MKAQDNQTSFWKAHSNILLLFLILGLSIRSYNLGSHNMWLDEVSTFVALDTYFEKLSLYKLFSVMSLLNHHLYYILLKPWTIFFGKNEFGLRSLSMIFGALSIPLIYKLGKLFFNARVGLISSFILSVSPIHIWYSQEARGYCLSTFLVMLVVYLFSLAAEKNRLNLWIGFIVSSTLAVYSNYSCIYAIIIISVFVFQKKYRCLLKKWLATLCFISIAFLPQLPNLIKSLVRIENNYWIPKPHLSSIVTTLENFNVGYNATPGIYFLSFMVFSSLFLFGIWRWWQEKSKVLIFLISLLLAPIIFTFLISQVIPVYLDRQLMLFSPFYYIIISSGLCKIKIRIIKAFVYLFISVVTAICIYNYFSYYMPAGLSHHTGVNVKRPVKPAADYINERFIEGDVVGFSGPSSVALSYYLRELILKKKIEVFSFVIKAGLEGFWKRLGEEKRYGIYFSEGRVGIPFRNNRGISVVILDEEISRKKFEKNNFKRLWLISSSWARDGILGPHEYTIGQWMRIYYSILDSKEFDGIFIGLYTKKQ